MASKKAVRRCNRVYYIGTIYGQRRTARRENVTTQLQGEVIRVVMSRLVKMSVILP